jgi:hypothetical protein
MARAHLDRDELRRLLFVNDHEPSHPDVSTTGEPAPPDGPVTFSRRDLIKMAGALAVGTSALAKLGPPVPVRVERGPDSVTLTIDGLGSWTLDAGRFSGTPRIAVTRTKRGTTIKLTGARYPGTPLSADLTCVVDPASPNLRFRTALSQGDAFVDARSWIVGKRVAEWSLAVRQAWDLGSAGKRLALQGPGRLALSSDMALTLEGPGVAKVTGLGGELVSGKAIVAMAAADAPSVLKRKLKKRTMITLERGDRTWDIHPAAEAKSGTLQWDGDPFDSLTIESGESAAGTTYRAAVARSRGAGPVMRFYPTAAFDPGGPGGYMSFSNPVYAMVLDGEEAEATIMAARTNPEEWLRVGSQALMFAEAEGASPFEVGFRPGRRTTVRYTSSLAGLATAMGEGVSSILKFAGKQSVSLGDLLPHGVPDAGQPVQTLLVSGSYQLDGESVYTMRAADMLVLEFRLFNVTVSCDGTTNSMTRTDKSKPAYLAVCFPGQAMREEFITTAAMPNGTPPLRALWSGCESRLAFMLPDAVIDAVMPFSLESLLSWGFPGAEASFAAYMANTLPFIVRGGADGRGALDGTTAPSSGVDNTGNPPHTAIEAPYSVFMQPGYPRDDSDMMSSSWFRNPRAPAQTNGAVALWHTMLQQSAGADYDRRGEAPSRFATFETSAINAVYTENVPRTSELAVWDGPLTPTDRANIVANSFSVFGWDRTPIMAKTLYLTAQGATLDAVGDWPNSPNSLKHWSHRMTVGRDQYVRTVNEGYLAPLGHRATRIDVTERIVVPAAAAGTVKYAALKKTTWLVVREPEKTYTYGGWRFVGTTYEYVEAVEDRDFPFSRVKIKTLERQPPGAGATDVFVVEAEDRRGIVSQFSMPLTFVATTATPGGSPEWLLTAGGASIAYADPGPNGQSTVLETADMRIGPVQKSSAVLAIDPVPDFRPRMLSARVRIPALRGFAALDTSTILLSQTYIQNGFSTPANVGQLFAELPDKPVMDTGATGSGGLANPNIVITGLSRRWGPVGGDLARFALGQADMTGYFGGTPSGASSLAVSGPDGAVSASGIWKEARLLGTKLLIDLIQGDYPLVDKSEDTPGIAAEVFDDRGDSRFSDNVSVLLSMDWDHSWTEDMNKLGFTLNATSRFVMRSRMRTQAIGKAEDSADGKPKSIVAEKTSVEEVKDRELTTTNAAKICHKNYSMDDWTWSKVQVAEVRNTEENERDTVVYSPGTDYTVELGEGDHFTYLVVPEGSSIGTDATLYADYVYTQPATGLSTYARLDNFGLQVPPDTPWITIKFGHLQFISLPSAKPDVGTKVLDVEFSNALAFIQELKEYLCVLDGMGVKLRIGTEKAAVFAKVTIAIPSIALGPFALMNISLMAKILVPLTGDPVSLAFGFSTREDPFQLSILAITGKGFLLMEFDPSGMKMFEASLEFGASLQFSLGGLATGSVSVTGGIYFRWVSGGGFEFMGFYKTQGNLKILGLITVSVCFMLELGYRSKGWTDNDTRPALKAEELYGKATVSVGVSVFMFKKTVTLTLERSIAGSDPTFGDAMPTQEDWNSYVDAFSPVPIGRGGV